MIIVQLGVEVLNVSWKRNRYPDALLTVKLGDPGVVIHHVRYAHRSGVNPIIRLPAWPTLQPDGSLAWQRLIELDQELFTQFRGALAQYMVEAAKDRKAMLEGGAENDE